MPSAHPCHDSVVSSNIAHNEGADLGAGSHARGTDRTVAVAGEEAVADGPDHRVLGVALNRAAVRVGRKGRCGGRRGPGRDGESHRRDGSCQYHRL